MDKINEQIEKQQEKLDQLKRKKRAQEMRESKKTRTEDTRRKIVIGGIVLKYFPQLSQLQPQRNNADNDKEFELFANVLSVLASDKELVERLTAQAWDKIKASVPPSDTQ